jgi:hypothetical protein
MKQVAIRLLENDADRELKMLIDIAKDYAKKKGTSFKRILHYSLKQYLQEKGQLNETYGAIQRAKTTSKRD